jgi:hypothetical protein
MRTVAFCRTCCGSWSEDDEPVKLLVILALAVMTSGCRFWYKPVPVANAIGEEKTVLAGDSMHVHRDARFEVYGPSSEAVYDGYEQLNRANRAFERHFGTSAPKLAFVLFRDSIVPLEPNQRRAFRNRGFLLVEYARPRSVRTRRRYGGIDYGGVQWPIAPTAARTMLARFAESQLEPDGDRADSLLLDRFPAWYRAAVFHRVGEAGAFANDLEYVREKRAVWWGFPELVTLIKPASADSLLDPSRRSEADDMTRLFAAQSTALGRYLIEREGPAVLGRLGRGYMAGRKLAEMTTEFHRAPRSLRELEVRWKIWIDTPD